MKRLADGLTAMRFVLVVPILVIGVTQPVAQGLGPVVWLTLLAWTTDALDGPMAQRARFPRQTWLGEHDLEADLSLMLALGAVMLLWGMLAPVFIALGVMGGWLGWGVLRGDRFSNLCKSGVWSDRTRLAIDSAPLQATIGIIYGGFMVGVTFREPALGRTLWAWLGISLAVYPRRSWHRFSSFFVVGRGFLQRRLGRQAQLQAGTSQALPGDTVSDSKPPSETPGH